MEGAVRIAVRERPLPDEIDADDVISHGPKNDQVIFNTFSAFFLS